MPTAPVHRAAFAAACAFVLAIVVPATGAPGDLASAAGMAPDAAAAAPAAPAAPQEGQGEQPPAETAEEAEEPEPEMTDAEKAERAEAVVKGEMVDGVPRPGVYRPKRDKVELPPGEEWLTDERGERYYLKEIPKSDPWRWAAETHIRVQGQGAFEVAEERDDAFVVKVYERPQGIPAPDRRAPSEEEIAAVAASYQPQAPASNRLRFRSFSEGLPVSGQWRNGFGLGDMNGDGHLDIVHGPARKGRYGWPVIFLGDGAGNWRAWEEARFPSIGYSYGDAAAADFNGDGHLDVALGQHVHGVVVMIGDGKGKFEPWSEGLPWEIPGQGRAALGFSSRQVEVADWNRDGRPDLLALGEGPRPAREGPYKSEGVLPSSSFGVAVFLNQGDGSWKRLDQGMQFGQIFGDHLAVGDFDGDRRIDFVTSSNAFGRRDLVALADPKGNWDHVLVEPARDRAYTRGVAAADFDGDGRFDLALSTVASQVDRWWSAIDVLLAREDGWVRRTLHGAEGKHWASALAAGDLDGDGNADLVAITDEGATWVFLGAGDGSFSREQADAIPAMQGGCKGYGLALADLDGDGRDEIVSSFAGESSAMFAPNRCPSFGALRAWDAERAEPAAASDRSAPRPAAERSAKPGA